MQREDIELILETASGFKDVLGRDIKKVPALRGRTAVNLFYEPSTRTRTSFELAAKRLSTDVINISTSTSSVVKGETLLDTARTVLALGADFIILRHSCSGAAHFLAKNLNASVVNAGDGTNEHPTQALARPVHHKGKKGRDQGTGGRDCRRYPAQQGGEIEHLRAYKTWAPKYRLIGPPTLVPAYLKELGCRAYSLT